MWRRPASRTSSCSRAASASPPTSSPRRCTPSRPRAATSSRCAPRARRPCCARPLRRTSTRRATSPSSSDSGSYYRYERPQKGRYRHFSQVGAEAIGAEDPALDAEFFYVLAVDAYRALGLKGVRMLLNSLGDKERRPPTATRCRTSCARSTSTRRHATCRHQPAPRPRRQASRASRSSWSTHRCIATTCATAAARTTSSVRVRCSRRRASRSRTTRGWCAASTTTRARSSSSSHDGLGSQSAVGGGGRYDGLSETARRAGAAVRRLGARRGPHGPVPWRRRGSRSGAMGDPVCSPCRWREEAGGAFVQW